jgi:hypothetical protein
MACNKKEKFFYHYLSQISKEFPVFWIRIGCVADSILAFYSFTSEHIRILAWKISVLQI